MKRTSEVVFINQSKYGNDINKKIGIDSTKPCDITMTSYNMLSNFLLGVALA